MKRSMHQGAGTREQMIAVAAFFFLFPGFFFYHTLLGTGTTGAFLGGYFSPMALAFVLPLAAVLFKRLRRHPERTSLIEVHYAVFMSYFFIIIVCNTLAGANLAIVVNHLQCILFMTSTFVIFSVIDFSGLAFRLMGLASLAAMSAIAFSYSVNGVFYLGAMGIAKDADSLATYQGFARSYLFTCLPMIAYTRFAPFRLAMYAIGAATLFVNTARSEFVALLFVIPIIEFYFSRQKVLFLLTVMLAGVALNLYLDQLMATLPDNRILELTDLSQSTSATKRHHLSMHAMQTIAAHPLLGDYASYDPGYYSHNILSAWVDLGLFGFVYLNALLVLPAIPMCLHEYLAGRRRGDFILGFSLACATMLLLLTSHYFTDMLIGATLGVYTQYRYRRKYGHHRAPHVRPSAPGYADLHQTVSQHGSARA